VSMLITARREVGRDGQDLSGHLLTTLCCHHAFGVINCHSWKKADNLMTVTRNDGEAK